MSSLLLSPLDRKASWNYYQISATATVGVNIHVELLRMVEILSLRVRTSCLGIIWEVKMSDIHQFKLLKFKSLKETDEIIDSIVVNNI